MEPRCSRDVAEIERLPGVVRESRTRSSAWTCQGVSRERRALKVVLLPRVAPLLELAGRQRQVAVQHRVQDGHEGHVRHDGFEERRPHVQASTDQHAAGGAADNRHIPGRGELVVGELVGHGDEVEKGALLGEELGRLVPRLSEV